MDFAKSQRWHPVDFLEFWVDDKVDQQLPNPNIACQLAQRFIADAATQGFTLADFNFNDVTLLRHMVQSMAAPRV